MNMQQKFLMNKDGLLKIVRRIIPEVLPDNHKGNCGRIGIIGGSFEYTGAPYFAGISSLKAGADLSYIFCASDAAIPIKSYSPELIVLPVLDSIQSVQNQALPLISRLHAVVLGPGLGRNANIAPGLQMLVDEIKRLNVPLVVDADGLYFVNESPSLVKDYQRAILTPNVVEFGRLQGKLGLNPDSGSSDFEAVLAAAKCLGCNILKKGKEDIITDGNSALICDFPGSGRRCGGQGDLLSGSLGTFLAWSFANANISLDGYSPPLVAGLAATLLTRKCNSSAFAKNGRGMITTDMIQEIPSAFSSLFANDQ